MGTAAIADQQRVANGEIARAFGTLMRHDLTAISIVGLAGGDAFGDDAARRVAADVQHLGAAIDLLMSVRYGDRIKLAARVVAAQDAARIFPGDRRTGFNLG